MIKKSFTLIELLVTMLLSSMLYYFIFSFEFNFLNVLKDMEAREKLAMNSFKLMQIATKGLNNNGVHIPGVMSASLVPGSGNKFKQHDDNKFWIFDRSSSFLEFDTYIYRNLNLNSNLSLLDVEDLNGDKKGIYRLKFDSEIQPDYYNTGIPIPRYNQYLGLVYTK